MRKIYKYFKFNIELLLLIPIISFNIFFILGGTIKGFIDSFGNNLYVNGWYIDNQFIFFDKKIIESILYTLKIASLSTIVSLFIAVTFIYIIHMTPQIGNIIKRVFYLPILTPYLLIAFFMLYTFSTSGFLNRILFNLGLIDNLKSAPIYINDTFGLGIILAYIWKAAPFLTLFILSVYENFNQDFVNLSSSLGATKTKTFFSIILPYLKKSIIYAVLIIFVYIFSAIELPLILGPTRPQTLSQLAYQNFQNGNLINRSRSLAINSSILIFNMSIISVIAINFFKGDSHEKDI